MITLKQAKNLKPGDMLLSTDKTTWKVIRKPVVWFNRPSLVEVPITRGFHMELPHYITEADLADFTLANDHV